MPNRSSRMFWVIDGDADQYLTLNTYLMFMTKMLCMYGTVLQQK